jgi:hypothetical protein
MHVPCLLLIKIDNQVLDCRLDSAKGVLMQWVSLAPARGVMKEGFVASIQVLDSSSMRKENIQKYVLGVK